MAYRACGEAAIALRPGRPGRRPKGARRLSKRLRCLVPGNAARRARGTWKWRESGALAAVSCCVVQRCCRSCRNVNCGTRSSEEPRAAANVRSTNHAQGAPERLQRRRSCFIIRLSVYSAAELSTTAKVARHLYARRRARKKSCSLE
eukprot:6194486-Pleurochrysis_carterae.AAC.1